jgi:hypothetical protein
MNTNKTSLNPKSEARNPKKAPSPKSQTLASVGWDFWTFGLRSIERRGAISDILIRVKNRPVNLLAIGSVAMCFAVLFLFISTWNTDAFRAPYHTFGSLMLRVAGGEVEFSQRSHGRSFTLVFSRDINDTSKTTPSRLCMHQAAGFGWDAAIGPASGLPRAVIPDWFLFVVAMAPAVGWFLERRRLKRTKLLGICLICGYDLRATPERCPECATATGRLE